MLKAISVSWLMCLGTQADDGMYQIFDLAFRSAEGNNVISHRLCLRTASALSKAFLDAQSGFKTQLAPTSGQLGPNLAPTWLRNRSQKAPQDLKIWRANIVTENDCNFDSKIIAFCVDFLKSFVIASEVVFLLRYQKRMSKKHTKTLSF